MNHDLGILFLHHEINEVVRNNLLSIRRQNPCATIITTSAGEALPGGYSLDSTPKIRHLHSKNPRRSSDWLVCSWFVQRKETCKKWWIVEWDTFCNVPVCDYYNPVWSFPFVASNVRLRHREHAWWWFREVDELPHEYKPFCLGAVPFLYLVDEFVLEQVCQALLSNPILVGNGEMRFATAANKCGFPPCGYSPPHDQITWINWEKPVREKAIYHPLKHYIDPAQWNAGS
jgi:hypothetical protein